MRSDDSLASHAPLSKDGETQVLTLLKITGVNVTPLELKPGYYQCRVPNGTSADTVTLLWKDSAALVADTALGLPAGHAAGVAGLQAAPADAWFPIHVHFSAKFLAAAWNGAASSTLIVTRVWNQ